MSLVMGEGPRPCDVMIVGEAPGATEEELGRPFVGRSGQLLNKALAAAGLAREDTYITNVYKLRPPNNRTPTVSELVDGMEVLAWELEKVQPKFVLLLGKTALSVLAPRDMQTLSKVRKVNLSPQLEHMTYATYHPSAGLRNPEWREAMFEDIAEFAKLVHKDV